MLKYRPDIGNRYIIDPANADTCYWILQHPTNAELYMFMNLSIETSTMYNTYADGKWRTRSNMMEAIWNAEKYIKTGLQWADTYL